MTDWLQTGSRANGQEWINGLFQQQARMTAGRQLSDGQTGAAANTMFRSGDLAGGREIQANARTTATADRATQLATANRIALALKEVRDTGQDLGAALQAVRPAILALGTDEREFAKIEQQVLANPQFLDDISRILDAEATEYSDVAGADGDRVTIGLNKRTGRTTSQESYVAPRSPTVTPFAIIEHPNRGLAAGQAPLPGQGAAPVAPANGMAGPPIGSGPIYDPARGEAPVPPPPAPPVPGVPIAMDDSVVGDRDAVIRMLVAEAGVDGPQGMQAVAGVIGNRAAQTGLTYEQVIRQANQFEPMGTASGRDRMARIDPNSPQYRAAAAALDAVLQGGDPTNGADHFYSPGAQAALGRPAPSWAQGEPTRVGRQNFYKLGYGDRSRPQGDDAVDLPVDGGGGQETVTTPNGYRITRFENPAEVRAEASAARAERSAERQDANAARAETREERTAQRQAAEAASAASARVFTQENQLRGQLGQNGAIKNLVAVRPQIGVIRNIAQRAAAGERISAQDDIALIFSFMKMLDPTSVVREGEFATAQNSGGVSDRIVNTYNNMLDGTRLSDRQRGEFFQTAARVMAEHDAAARAAIDRTRNITESYGLNPDRVAPLPPPRTAGRPRIRFTPTEQQTAVSQSIVRSRASEGRRGEQTNPILINPADPTTSYGNVRSGQYFITPSGEVRRKP